ncbi:neural cell adhesion molecule 2-like [Penaeus monodon]|uniref:neural cell adhesion molecule 2-like n=1 Tax=Penaeus monodon TaxID=6687 RepID=UPI0018A7A7E8|nr:neural cell adhesion molecule 2-like [Penaeus monodon]
METILEPQGWCVGGGTLTAANILTYSGVLPGRPPIIRYNTTTPSPPSLVRNEGAYIQVPSKPVTTTGSTGAFTPPARFNNQILPSFANTTETNVTVIRDKTAYLHCHVLNLGTKTVSWVRHEDIHVLTVGRLTFTNDDRFVAMNKPGSDVWSLRIKFPQLKDSGRYECQVSTRPLRSKVITLNVVEPQAIIPPAPELYVDFGSPLNITCVIPDSPEPPEHLFWYHRDKMVSWDGTREGVTITTNRGKVTTSTLFIPDVTAQDSGVYICAPQGMKEASVTVSVLNGERTQAMQTGSTCRGCVGSFVLLLLSAFYHLLG